MMDNQQKFLSPDIIARRLDLSVETIYRMIRAKRLRAYKFGKSYRIAECDYNSFLLSASTINE